MLLGVPSSRTFVKCSWVRRYQCLRLRVPLTSRASGILRCGMFRMESQSARVSSLSMRASLLAPAPPRRLAFQIADRDERGTEDGGVCDEANGLPRRQDDDGAQGQQCHEGRQHEPALPGAGRPPAPAVALCREPVVRRGHGSLHRDRERGYLGRRDILLPWASIFEAQLLLSGLERRELPDLRTAGARGASRALGGFVRGRPIDPENRVLGLDVHPAIARRGIARQTYEE